MYNVESRCLFHISLYGKSKVYNNFDWWSVVFMNKYITNFACNYNWGIDSTSIQFVMGNKPVISGNSTMSYLKHQYWPYFLLALLIHMRDTQSVKFSYAHYWVLAKRSILLEDLEETLAAAINTMGKYFRK